MGAETVGRGPRPPKVKISERTKTAPTTEFKSFTRRGPVTGTSDRGRDRFVSAKDIKVVIPSRTAGSSSTVFRAFEKSSPMSGERDIPPKNAASKNGKNNAPTSGKPFEYRPDIHDTLGVNGKGKEAGAAREGVATGTHRTERKADKTAQPKAEPSKGVPQEQPKNVFDPSATPPKAEPVNGTKNGATTETKSTNGTPAGTAEKDPGKIPGKEKPTAEGPKNGTKEGAESKFGTGKIPGAEQSKADEPKNTTGKENVNGASKGPSENGSKEKASAADGKKGADGSKEQKEGTGPKEEAKPSFNPDAGDYYERFGLGRNATQEEIKAAYRRAARQFHPDINGPEAAENFRKIQQAYETLSSKDKRAAYDLSGEGKEKGGARAHGAGSSRRTGGERRGWSAFDADDFEARMRDRHRGTGGTRERTDSDTGPRAHRAGSYERTGGWGAFDADAYADRMNARHGRSTGGSGTRSGTWDYRTRPGEGSTTGPRSHERQQGWRRLRENVINNMAAQEDARQAARAEARRRAQLSNEAIPFSAQTGREKTATVFSNLKESYIARKERKQIRVQFELLKAKLAMLREQHPIRRWFFKHHSIRQAEAQLRQMTLTMRHLNRFKLHRKVLRSGTNAVINRAASERIKTILKNI